MATDSYGNEIGMGDTVAFVVGIPGRVVRAEVYEKVDRRGSRLFVREASGSEMALRFVLEYFNCEVVERRDGKKADQS